MGCENSVSAASHDRGREERSQPSGSTHPAGVEEQLPLPLEGRTRKEDPETEEHENREGDSTDERRPTISTVGGISEATSNPLQVPSERELTDIEILSQSKSSGTARNRNSGSSGHHLERGDILPNGQQQAAASPEQHPGHPIQGSNKEVPKGPTDGFHALDGILLLPEGRHQETSSSHSSEGEQQQQQNAEGVRGGGPIHLLDEESLLVNEMLHGASRFRADNGEGSLFSQLYLQTEGTRLFGRLQPPSQNVAPAGRESPASTLLNVGLAGSVPLVSGSETEDSADDGDQMGRSGTSTSGSGDAISNDDKAELLMNAFSVEQRLEIQQKDIGEGRVKDGSGLLWPCPISLLQHMGGSAYRVNGVEAREEIRTTTPVPIRGNQRRSENSFTGSSRTSILGNISDREELTINTLQKGEKRGISELEKISTDFEQTLSAAKEDGLHDKRHDSGERNNDSEHYRESSVGKVHASDVLKSEMETLLEDAPPFVAKNMRGSNKTVEGSNLPTAPRNVFTQPTIMAPTLRIETSDASVSSSCLGASATTSSSPGLQSTIGFDEAWHRRAENFFLAPLEFIHDDYSIHGVRDADLRAERKAATLHILDYIPTVVHHLESGNLDEIETFAQKCLKSSRRTALFKLESVFTQLLASTYDLRAIMTHPTEFLKLVDLSPGRHVFDDFEEDSYSGYGYNAALFQKQQQWLAENPQFGVGGPQPPDSLLQVEWNYALLRYLEDRLRHDIIYSLLVAKALSETIKRDNLSIMARTGLLSKSRKNRKRK